MLALKHQSPLWHHSETISSGTSEKKAHDRFLSFQARNTFFLSKHLYVYLFFVCKPTFDDWQAAPLDLLPEAAQQPRIDFLQQLGQVLWIRLHDLVKLSKLAGAHKHKVRRDPTLVISGWAFYWFVVFFYTLVFSCCSCIKCAHTFPGLKKTLVNPNLKSLSFSPRALNKACRYRIHIVLSILYTVYTY